MRVLQRRMPRTKRRRISSTTQAGQWVRARALRLCFMLLRMAVVTVRRAASMYLFVAVMALGMGAVKVSVPDLLTSARALGVQQAFVDTRNDMAKARTALKSKRFAGCVYNPVAGKVHQIVCAPKELVVVEVMVVLMLFIGKVTSFLALYFMPWGVGAVVLRFAFDRMYARAARKRREAFNREMNQYPYYTAIAV